MWNLPRLGVEPHASKARFWSTIHQGSPWYCTLIGNIDVVIQMSQLYFLFVFGLLFMVPKHRLPHTLEFFWVKDNSSVFLLQCLVSSSQLLKASEPKKVTGYIDIPDKSFSTTIGLRLIRWLLFSLLSFLIVDLQCTDNFWCATKWLSYTYIEDNAFLFSITVPGDWEVS